MQNKLLPWCVALGLMMTLALESAVAQSRAPGSIKATAVKGTVTVKEANGSTSSVSNDQALSQGETVMTSYSSSVVLVFSNGASINLGSDSELVISEFTQDPIDSSVNPAALKTEPTTSVTSLKLNKGDLTGSVKKLNYAKGSTFTVNTPVGAAGIRGTVFHLVYTVDSAGKASFKLVTLEGVVVASNGAISTPVDVGSGKEVTFEVDVDTATGELKSPPSVVNPGTASSSELATISSTLQAIIEATPIDTTTTTTTDTGSTGSNDTTQPPNTTPGAGGTTQG